MGNMYTTKTIQYKDRQHVSATCTPPKQLTAKMGNMHTTKTVLVVYILPIFVVNCFGGVHVAVVCS
jgi:hypothetical protein